MNGLDKQYDLVLTIPAAQVNTLDLGTGEVLSNDGVTAKVGWIKGGLPALVEEYLCSALHPVASANTLHPVVSANTVHPVCCLSQMKLLSLLSLPISSK